MKPVPIPKDVLDSLGAKAMIAKPPDQLSGVEDCYTARVKDGYQILIKLDDEDIKAIDRSHSLWLNFKAGDMFPVFSLRPSEIILKPKVFEREYPRISAVNFDLMEEARNSWQPFVKLASTVYMKRLTEDTLIETNEGEVIGKTGDWLAHDPASGHFWPVQDSYKEIHYIKYEHKREDNEKTLPGVLPETES